MLMIHINSSLPIPLLLRFLFIISLPMGEGVCVTLTMTTNQIKIANFMLLISFLKQMSVCYHTIPYHTIHLSLSFILSSFSRYLSLRRRRKKDAKWSVWSKGILISQIFFRVFFFLGSSGGTIKCLISCDIVNRIFWRAQNTYLKHLNGILNSSLSLSAATTMTATATIKECH